MLCLTPHFSRLLASARLIQLPLSGSISSLLPFSSVVEILGVGSADCMLATEPPDIAWTVPVTGSGTCVVAAGPIVATAFMPGVGGCDGLVPL